MSRCVSGCTIVILVDDDTPRGQPTSVRTSSSLVGKFIIEPSSCAKFPLTLQDLRIDVMYEQGLKRGTSPSSVSISFCEDLPVPAFHCSFLHLQLNSVSMFHPDSLSLLLAPVPASLRLYKLSSQQRVLHALSRTMPRILYPQQTTLATIGRPHTRTSSLAHRRPYGCPLCA